MRQVGKWFQVVAIAVILAGCATLPPGTESDWLQICERVRAPKDRIGACTALIDSGKLKPMELSTVLTLRADAYLGLIQYERAIADTDQALSLNPEQVWAYIHRGTAYKRSWRLDLAIADFDQALRLAPPTSERCARQGRGNRPRSPWRRLLHER